MTATRSDGRKVLASFNSWEAFGHSLDHVELSAPTPDDVPRVKLDGPPATADQIDAAFRRVPERKARK